MGKKNPIFTSLNVFYFLRNELHDYMDLLVRNFNLKTVDNLMCLNLLSVNWDGKLFDCDFNQQLDIGVSRKGKKSQLMRLWYLSQRRPAKAQASLCISADSPEPLLFAHTEYGSRRRVQKSDI